MKVVTLFNGDLSSVDLVVNWGEITGTLSDQTDLQAALDGKVGEAPTGGNAFRRQGGFWVADPIQTDAPSDGNGYVRQSGGWALNQDWTYEGLWLPKEYAPQSLVYDSGPVGLWTMLSNKQTTERAGPASSGDPQFVTDRAGTFPETPPTIQIPGTAFSGMRYFFPQYAHITAVRFYAPDVTGNFTYELWVEVEGQRLTQLVAPFTPAAVGWITIAIDVLPVPGQAAVITLITRATSQPNTLTGNWDVANQNGNPNPGQARFQNNAVEIRVNKTDADGGSRGAELLSVAPGGTFEYAGETWNVDDVTDGGSYVTYLLEPDQGRPTAGLYELSWEWGNVGDTPVALVADHFSTYPNATGFAGNEYPGTYSDDWASVDILTDELIVSDDWDFVALSKGLSVDPAQQDVVLWGDILGTLSDQLDLQAALDAKLNEPTGFDGQVIVHDGTGWDAGYVEWGNIAGVLSDQLDLQAALDGKAPIVHTHAIADVNGLQAELDGKAPTVHLHAIADVTGLQAELDLKLEDAPTDGNQYARQSGAWTIVQGLPPGTANQTLRYGAADWEATSALQVSSNGVGVGATPAPLSSAYNGGLFVDAGQTSIMQVSGSVRAGTIWHDSGGTVNRRTVRMVSQADGFTLDSLSDAQTVLNHTWLYGNQLNGRLSIGAATAPASELHLWSASSPEFRLQTNGVSGYTSIRDDGANQGRVRNITAAGDGASRLLFDANPLDGTSQAAIRVFLSTSTSHSGGGDLQIYSGDGSNDLQHRLRGPLADSHFCAFGGNLGVGTNAPSEKLHVNGFALADGFIASGPNGDSQVRIQGAAGDEWYLRTYPVGFADGRLDLHHANGGISYGVNYGEFPYQQYHHWLVGNFERMRLTSDGLGVFLTDPSQALDVGGGVRVRSLDSGQRRNCEVFSDGTLVLGGIASTSGAMVAGNGRFSLRDDLAWFSGRWDVGNTPITSHTLTGVLPFEAATDALLLATNGAQAVAVGGTSNIELTFSTPTTGEVLVSGQYQVIPDIDFADLGLDWEIDGA